MTNFEPAFQKTLSLEVGYSDDPLIGAAEPATGSARRRPGPMVIRARWRRCRSNGRGGFTRRVIGTRYSWTVAPASCWRRTSSTAASIARVVTASLLQ